jgi:hypothetical protein
MCESYQREIEIQPLVQRQARSSQVRAGDAKGETSNEKLSRDLSFDRRIVDDHTATAQRLFIGSRISSPSSGFSLYWTATPDQNYNIEVSTGLVKPVGSLRRIK